MMAFLLALLTTLLWGIAPLFEKLALTKVEPLVLLPIRTGFVTMSVLTILLLSGSAHELAKVDSKSVGFILLSGLFGGTLGLTAYFHAMKLGEASKVVLITGSYPLVTTLLAILFLHEALTFSKLLGAAFVVIGILLLR
jgi:transporter family protein